MATTSAPTRRSFIRTAGAAFSAPLAMAGVTVAAAEPAAADSLQARLARLEGVEAIRALNQAYARHVSSGAREELVTLFADPAQASNDPELRGITAEGLGERDVIEIAADGLTAAARLYCTVQRETVIDADCALVEMARAQGGGVVRSSESAVIEVSYIKQAGAWKIESAK